ncbi:NADB Rossmann superfamily protein [Rhodoferax antarcticus ANT.BR]|uniref:NADB Rossmann superfamily protein n=1 Tax=Rhodoferax antarcticus ANT.BR TaxID=1111071 RepID=A0A1Q8YCE6_9BURK|nr:NADB Rossmann superfamily protein [Rhodoferax antarcticus ANT.BR]
MCQAVIRYFRDLNAYAGDIRAGHWTYYKPRQRSDFSVGVMGLGVLGARVAQALQQFEFPVSGWSRSPKALHGVRTFMGAAQLPDFLASSLSSAQKSTTVWWSRPSQAKSRRFA